MKGEAFRKYNTKGPRYTSYPAVPHWDRTPTPAQWAARLKETFDHSNAREGISLYIHLPYCESLCTYCGCTKRITVNHEVEAPYVDAVLAEWQQYLAILGDRPQLRELHLGGGTPTFFSPENLTRLISGILASVDLMPRHDLSFEGHPNNTTTEHLQALFHLGFRRVSLGIQDFDPAVQEVINRIQPYEVVERVTREARAIGYTSVNYDLVYGLPLQSRGGLIKTIRMVEKLNPDRIAYYSYAHVPWVAPGQRRYTEADLPLNEEKLKLYQIGCEMFREMGYQSIGMDHFAKPNDALSSAVRRKRLHRNFMGYTPNHTEVMIGLGASAISDCWTAFAQNVKSVEGYVEQVQAGKLPIFRGHLLSEENLVVRRHILDLMCNYRTRWEAEFPALQAGMADLREMEADGLVKLTEGKLVVRAKGKAFVRNVCMALDPYLQERGVTDGVFSGVV